MQIVLKSIRARVSAVPSGVWCTLVVESRQLVYQGDVLSKCKLVDNANIRVLYPMWKLRKIWYQELNFVSNDDYRYEIKSGRRRAWDIAVVSAEDAYSMSIGQRCKEYTFTYLNLNKKKKEDDSTGDDKDMLPNGALQRKRKHDKEQVSYIYKELFVSE